MQPQTLGGLYDTLEDLQKQLDKAEEKYNTLRTRVDAVRDAINELEKP